MEKNIYDVFRQKTSNVRNFSKHLFKSKALIFDMIKKTHDVCNVM